MNLDENDNGLHLAFQNADVTIIKPIIKCRLLTKTQRIPFSYVLITKHVLFILFSWLQWTMFTRRDTSRVVKLW